MEKPKPFTKLDVTTHERTHNTTINIINILAQVIWEYLGYTTDNGVGWKLVGPIHFFDAPPNSMNTLYPATAMVACVQFGCNRTSQRHYPTMSCQALENPVTFPIATGLNMFCYNLVHFFI